MKCESTDIQERAQQLWRELDGLDWSSHEIAIVGMIRDALEQACQEEFLDETAEPCCFCGRPQQSGIFIRENPEALMCKGEGVVHAE